MLACGVVLAVTAAVFVFAWERDRTTGEFERRAQAQAHSLAARIRGYNECLNALRILYEASREVTADEFHRAAFDLRRRNPGVLRLEWIERGSDERVAELRVAYCEPIAGNERLIGIDRAAQRDTDVFDRALAANDTAATGLTTIDAEDRGEFGWLMATPVFENGAVPAAKERRGAVLGYVACEVRLRNFLEHAFADGIDSNVDLLLVDESRGATEPLLAAIVRGQVLADPPAPEEFRRVQHERRPLRVGDREWELLFRPAYGRDKSAAIYSAVVLLFGLALTGLAAALIVSAQRRTVDELRDTQRRLSEDIEQRERVEHQAMRVELQLHAALAAAKLGIWEWDVQADKIAWSETTARIFGFAPGTFRGGIEDYLALVHPDDRAASRGRLHRAATEGGAIAGELRIARRDGSVRWVSSRGNAVSENGRVARIIGAVMDVTEQHEAAEEKAGIERRLQEWQKLESLGVLAGGIAHDFNNLLAGILGNAGLARMDLPENMPVQGYLAAIEKTTERAASLCQQMLAYSGKGRFVVEQLDLSEIVKETPQLISASISHHATLDLQLAPDLPPVSADVTQMRQIVMNLVLNASDAIGDAPGTITIRTGRMKCGANHFSDAKLAPRDPDGEFVFLEVRDTGCGMSAETQSKIFDPFFTTKFTGRGLGLAAVLGIVRGHGGGLKVESAPGKGSVFRLLLPRAEGAATAHGARPLGDSDWRGSGTVLVIDDDETVRIASGKMLSAAGFDVVVAASGEEGIEIFRAAPGRFFAVLLDLTMPGMDGSEAFTAMRRIAPDARIVLMSGFTAQDALSRVGNGLAGFIQKPFTPESLRETFRKIALR